MACLFGCFSKFRHKKGQINVEAVSSTKQKNEDNEAIQSMKLENKEFFRNPTNPIPVTKENNEESAKFSLKKEGSFESNLKTHEELPRKVVRDDSTEKKEEIDSDVDQKISKETQLKPNLNYRYENCAESETSFEGFGFEQCETVVDGNGGNGKSFEMEESSESLFSLSIDSRKQFSDVELGGEKEVLSPLMKETVVRNEKPQDQNPFSDSIKKESDRFLSESDKKESLCKDQEKENMGVEDENFDSSIKNRKLGCDLKKVPEQEIGVDTSLSSWLDEFDKTPSVGNSASKSRTPPKMTTPEGRCILGELNLKEQKQDSELMTIDLVEDDVLGTIGCYLSRTGKAIDESKRSGLFLA